jgi:hypothetical protein
MMAEARPSIHHAQQRIIRADGPTNTSLRCLWTLGGDPQFVPLYAKMSEY